MYFCIYIAGRYTRMVDACLEKRNRRLFFLKRSPPKSGKCIGSAFANTFDVVDRYAERPDDACFKSHTDCLCSEYGIDSKRSALEPSDVEPGCDRRRLLDRDKALVRSVLIPVAGIFWMTGALSMCLTSRTRRKV